MWRRVRRQSQGDRDHFYPFAGQERAPDPRYPEHENNPLLSEVEKQIIATEDINELRQLAVQKVKIMVDTLKQYIAKKPTSKNSIIKGIQGSSETVEQIKNYLNNSETEEDLSCKSIIVNIE